MAANVMSPSNKISKKKQIESIRVSETEGNICGTRFSTGAGKDLPWHEGPMCVIPIRQCSVVGANEWYPGHLNLTSKSLIHWFFSFYNF